MNTEILGTSNLERLIARSNLLSPEIAKGDKGISWDGHINVYKSPQENQPKSNLLFQVPVQVKTRGGTGDYFDIELADLKNYRNKGGTVFFKICVDEKGENERFLYKALLPGDCLDLLEKAKGNKKTKRVWLDLFPTDVPSVEAILTAFAEAMQEDSEKNKKRWVNYAPDDYPPHPEPPADSSRPVDPYQYNADVIPLHGREKEMEALRAFLDDSRSFCWWAIVGPGGAGKTRLAYEFQKEVKKQEGWTVQKLGINSVKTITEKSLDDYLAAYPGQTLLILDYAQQHAKALGQWFHRLTAGDWDWEPGMKLRVLLLERADKDPDNQYPWEKQMLQSGDTRRIRAARYAEIKELRTEDDPLLNVTTDFAAYLRRESPDLPALTNQEAADLLPLLEERKTPLFAMLLADAAIHRKLEAGWTWETLLKNVMERERGYLENSLRALYPENSLLETAAFQLLRAATVLSASGAPAWEDLAGLLPESADAVRQAAKESKHTEKVLLRRLGLMDRDGQHISPLRPDLFGEYMVLDWLQDKQNEAEETAPFFEAILSDEQAAETFFLRAVRDFGPMVQPQNGGFHDWLIPAGMGLSPEAAAALVSLLRTLFSGGQVERASWDAGAEKTTVFAKDKNTRSWLFHRMEGYTSGLAEDGLPAAHAYNDLGSVYQSMGNLPMALEYFKKALAIWETVLGTEHPDTATTYNNIGMLYLAQNQPEQAIPWLERAFSIVEAKLGSEHPHTQITREALEYARHSMP